MKICPPTGHNGHFCQNCPSLRPKKWHFQWPNQNSKTTFIVQTFPKYGPYDFYFVNLSLLGAILAIFQFCWFSGLFWPFSHCKIGYFCKIRLSNLAQDESSDRDSENCSEISAVTWFRIYPRLLQIPTLIFFTPPYSPYPTDFKITLCSWIIVTNHWKLCHQLSNGN